VILSLKVVPKVPVEAECISPDLFSGKSLEQVKNLEVLVGNKRKRLGDVFEVSEGPEGDGEIVIEGDLSRVKHVGAAMSFGKVVVKGDVGMHLGRQMKGGKIIVHGNAGDWTGAEMRGGVIRIKGNAGNLLGAAYRGSKLGMNRGMIVVEGNAGHEVGELMKRGIIAVVGDVASFAGAHMKGGTILCFGKIGGRAGAEMDRGTIIAFNELELLPTFRYDSTYNPTFLRALLRELRKYDLPVRQEHIERAYDRYSGDLAGLGKGEIFVWRGK
jgi:formylmethanofuran dehydrogenase subunit C